MGRGEFIQLLHGRGGGHGSLEGAFRSVFCRYRQPVEIGPGLEMLAGAADHQRPHGRVGPQLVQALDQGIQQVLVIGIAELRPVQGGGGDAALIDAEQDRGFGHGLVSLQDRAGILARSGHG
ncbi:hypothetical protein KSF81_12815 [Siccirubricoccus sp. G192]|nr:hypothetical protein [Siccirubricoccus sp. G192]MBV1797865.1 hypothetical protein [Siccirubricoccus sp. G192]